MCKIKQTKYNEGPVAVSDRNGYSDVKLIMRACNKNGLLLRPSMSAGNIDKVFKYRAFQTDGPNGELWFENRISFCFPFFAVCFFFLYGCMTMNMHTQISNKKHKHTKKNNEWICKMTTFAKGMLCQWV